MLDFNSVLAFSHTHCVAICAALVPLNLLGAIQVLLLTTRNRPGMQVAKAAGLTSTFALVMILHVMTWFIVGVVMVQTYILLWLGGVCLAISAWAVLHPQSQRRGVLAIAQFLKGWRIRTDSPS